MARLTWYRLLQLRRIVLRKSGVAAGDYDPAAITVDDRGLVTDAQDSAAPSGGGGGALQHLGWN